uniref:Uncharacterized protein n=1 Tax=Cajanus cajan TaxID=3821 RepID=A0A151SP74_CAJCA|nr:hypothetical protein KK1_002878 [Cajanus cajan]
MDPLQNPSSPYYLHPSESPATVLVSPPLIPSNYHSWAREMKRALISKNKFRFVDGTIEPPLDRFDPSFEAFERCNNIVQSWILNSLSPSIKQSVVYKEFAKDVWKDLKLRFSQGDFVRIAEIQQELYSFKQNSLSVSDFFTELRVLWEELENYRPLGDCRCTSKEYREQDYVMRFLMGLNDCFDVVKSHILLMDPLPSIEKAFSMVIQHERQHGLTPSGVMDSMVNLTEGKKSFGKGKNNSTIR